MTKRVVSLIALNELMFNASWVDAKRNVEQYLTHCGVRYWYAYDSEGDVDCIIWDEGRVNLWSQTAVDIHGEDDLSFVVWSSP